MDIGELSSYKPPNTSKRPAAGEEDDDDEWEIVRQSKKLDELTEKEKQDILNKETKAPEVEALDEATLERLILLFEKRALRNQKMRVKFPDQPEKFMESEVELHETMQKLQIAVTNPTNLYLYCILMVKLGAVPSLLELLSHKNTDIAVGVVELLFEFTYDTYYNILDAIQKESADTFINALLEQQVFTLLVQNLERLDETVVKEDTGVCHTLEFFDELLEFRPDLCADAGKQGLMQWLLSRVKIITKTFSDLNHIWACSLLSKLVEHTPENRLLLGDLDGIDVLLQQLAYLPRSQNREKYDDERIMKDLFDVLCSSLMATVNRDRFLRGGGLQIMNLMLREKEMSWDGSLKVLDHAMNGPDGKDNCSKFVDILGLRTIFPLFMKTPTRNRNRMRGLTAEDDEKHVISIIASLLKNCKGQQRQTLLSYFTENDYEKVNRLMELHFKYLEKVEEVRKKVEEVKKKVEEVNGKDDEDEEELYSRRLDGRLFILQLIDYVLLEACTGCPPAVKQRIKDLLAQRSLKTIRYIMREYAGNLEDAGDTVKQRMTRILAQRSLNRIRHIMREYAGNLGDAGDTEWKEAEQQRILQLIEKF
ncbi:beta-catenin-like protein 1 [Temnothorax longispinosus]|uniref:beta-catenin-like protein 1 n=1 Tax=Temnothorax longispinosus TaxID=300112 RepID=UPI003A99EFB7